MQTGEPEQESTATALATWGIVALSASAFSSKGVIAKLMYPLGIDPIGVLALRMGLALPVFLAVAWWSSRGAVPIRRADWLQMLGLGCIGYYLSPILDFTGLQYISVGLERMVLYTYPALVLLGARLFLHQPLRPAALPALLLASLGIVLSYLGELRLGGADVGWGMLLVFGCALSYSTFVLCASHLIERVGALRFMSIVVSCSSVLMLGHYAIQHGAAHLASYPAPVYDYALILALVGTVLPSLTLGAGLRRAGPQRFAVIGTIGPVTTVILAWLVLAEMPTLLQLVGFGCTLAGGLWVSLVRSRPARHGEGALAIGTAGSRCRAGSPAWQQRSRPPR